VPFDPTIYFDAVRETVFGGSLTQEQVDGQNFILASWENDPTTTDLRWLAYSLATTKHETASTMLPIEEYGKGGGMAYGKKDSQTGQTYYGRGFVQLTWRDNYAKATRELELEGEDDLEWHADRALDPAIAADIMFLGMAEGWFRGDSKGRQTLLRYFDIDTDDPYGAREIINGDKHIVPSWSNGVSIGKLIAGYHGHFLNALVAADVPVVEAEPAVVAIDIVTTGEAKVVITVNGKPIFA
jgi:hypothetical protein